MRILLVEDEESLRVTLAANLELEGYEVLEAEDGRRAVELLATEKVDFVLSDIRMPKLGGIDLLQLVKRDYPEIPVVLMTAQALEEQIETAICAGAFTVLRKPFDVTTALAPLVRAMERPVVLIVDGDRASATGLAAAFDAAGVAARAVFDGNEALSALHVERVDVCVTDLALPGMVELLRKIRVTNPDLAIVVFSAQEPARLLSRVSSAGFFACLRKPVAARELLAVVAKARGGQWAL